MGKKDTAWKYAVEIKEGSYLKIKCTFCNLVIPSGISRFKHHLVGDHNGVQPCRSVPSEVKEEMTRKKKELLSQGKSQASATTNEEVDLDELMDDPELEKLHADRIAALKKEAEKRQALKQQGHGEYRDISEGDFLGEVTGSEKVICHFYHREFYRCKIMDKHLKSLSLRHVETKFIRLDAENAPFFVTKLGIKTLPCVIFFRNGVAIDRVVGFQDLGAKDDFSTGTLERLLLKKGIITENKVDDEDRDIEGGNSRGRSVRSSINYDSDSD